MEALTAGNVGDVASHQRAGNNPTPRERFEARAERIAASAQERPKVAAYAIEAESYERDATPFGLRRRVRLPFVNGEQGHGWPALSASSRCALSDSHEIDQVKRACLEAARELLLEMISLETDLVRGRAKASPVRPR